MSSPAHSEASSVDIGHGIKVRLNSVGQWQVEGANGSWPLESKEDAHRAAAILEKGYAEMKAATDRLMEQQPTAHEFPFDNVVVTALESGSDYWASRALEWVPSLPLAQRQTLVHVLQEVVIAKWASQKLRQGAERQMKHLRSS